MKKLILTILSLIIVIGMYFIDFNVMNIKPLIEGGLNTNERLYVDIIDYDTLRFSFIEDKNEIEASIKRNYESNGEIEVKDLSKDLGVHTASVIFKLGHETKKVDCSYEIVPQIKERMLYARPSSSKKPTFYSSYTNEDIERGIRDSIITNGTMDFVTGVSARPGEHTVKVLFTKDNDRAFKYIKYDVIDYKKDKLNIETRDLEIKLPYGSSINMLRSYIMAKHPSNGILSLPDEVDLSIGSHKINATFKILGSEANSEIKEINYEIIKNPQGLILNDYEFYDDGSKLTVTYNVLNQTGIDVSSISDISLELFIISGNKMISIADGAMANINYSSSNVFKNDSSQMISFIFNSNDYIKSYFTISNLSFFTIFSYSYS